MKHTVILDSCFLIGTLDPTDAFHNDAMYIFNILLAKKVDVRIVIPPLVVYEVITTLIRKGIPFRKVQSSILKLLHVEKIMMLSIAETSAFKHAKKLLTPGSQANSLRTSDFLIICIGIDLDAIILSFDHKALGKIKPVYQRAYYCSSVGNHVEETSDFLHEFGLIPETA